MTLPDAEAALDRAGIQHSAKPKDGLFGIIVRENFVVCTEKRINDRMVRLEVAKHGC